MKHRLDPGELVVSDAGYLDACFINHPSIYYPPESLHLRIRSKHETMNFQLKLF